jgi:hypothetical protein
MTKALVFILAAVVDIAIAALAFRSGRIVIPVILVFAAACFVVAAIGQARAAGRPKIDQ